MSIGARIKQLRKDKKLTQTDLTEGFLTKGMLSLIENDKSTPSMETLIHIAKKLEVSVSYLTQDGDEAWTEEMVEYFDTLKGEFPFEEIKEKIEPNVNRIFPNEDGVRLLETLRYYYRFKQKNEKADELHEIIYKKLSELGLRHLANRELLNHAVSKMFALEYQDAFDTLETHKDHILNFSKYDRNLEIQYYSIASVLSSAIEDYKKFVDYSLKVESLSIEQLNFSQYYDAVRFLILYYTFTEDIKQKMIYVEKMKSYLNFLPNTSRISEFMDEEEFYYKYYLLDSREVLEARLLNYQHRLDQAETIETDKEWLKKLRRMNQIELAYVRGEYEKVIDNFDLSVYEFKQATHPIDRITRLVRSLAYALSLYELGQGEKAKHEVERVEKELGHLTESLYAKEYRLIKESIYEN